MKLMLCRVLRTQAKCGEKYPAEQLNALQEVKKIEAGGKGKDKKIESFATI
jgi:hypothetical protein